MNKNVKKIAVVGAGTAGLICAMILKRRLDVEIDVIYSSNIGIVGVGEGSTEQFEEFRKFMGISQREILAECDATYKIGIMFDGWTSDPNQRYMHSVFTDISQTAGLYMFVNAKKIIDQESLVYKDTHASLLFEGDTELDHPQIINQFHFNTHKLNDFLIRKSKEMGINFIDDDIEDVTLDENGNISTLIGSKNKYAFYDFFIDSTGFKRVLINKLGAKWNSYSKYLKVNSAITFPTEDEDNYNIWTLAKAMKNGWMFRLPVWGRYGNGYIYDKNHTTMEEAKKEVDEYFGRDIEIKKEFTFDPGCLEKFWIKNCCAVGLSGSFVEPLEATSIGSTIQQSFMLSHKLASYSEKDIELYNKNYGAVMENIRDYIILHYLTDRKDTEFWKETSSIELPEKLEYMLDVWKYRLPTNEDIFYDSGYILFRKENFIQIMYGLNKFDLKSLKREYYSYNRDLRDYTQTILNDVASRNYDRTGKITHKRFIEIIRNQHEDYMKKVMEQQEQQRAALKSAGY